MKKWNKRGNSFSLGDISNQINSLPSGVYNMENGLFGWYLERASDDFEFSHKLYGLETSLINRVIKTWNSTDRNLGVLLNGLKGTGKTVTAKVICNELNLPVIIVNSNPESGGIPEFLSEIDQDVIVLIDEYEKIFGNDSELLTLMDGVLSGTNRKLFILTTNNVHINENMIERPSRIRYFKTFKDLAPGVIEEIVDDTLLNKKFKADTIAAISNLQIITIDIVKSVIEEVNIHNESPVNFMDVFNVKKITGKYTIVRLDQVDGKTVETELAKNVKIWPREFDEERIGYGFEIDSEMIGRISEIISFDTILIDPNVEDEDDRPVGRRATKGKATASTKTKLEPFVIRVEVYDSIHRNYAYYQNFM